MQFGQNILGKMWLIADDCNSAWIESGIDWMIETWLNKGFPHHSICMAIYLAGSQWRGIGQAIYFGLSAIILSVVTLRDA